VTGTAKAAIDQRVQDDADHAQHRLTLYHGMVRIRAFEERAGALFREGQIPGFLHLSIGQEAVAVGATQGLEPGDVITSNHRGHGHVLAKGADMTSMFAELMGKETGTCRGRGGSMHIADVSHGIFGANGIVAGGLPISVGAALAAERRANGRVVVAFFGEGSVAQGAFHETVVVAQQLSLPLLLVCENNQYSEFTGTTTSQLTVEQLAGGYGLPFYRVDGNDVDAVAALADQLVDELRHGGSPALLEAMTLRMRGHYEGDAQGYRAADADAQWVGRDPLQLAERQLGLSSERIAEIRAEVTSEVDQAVADAQAAAEPDPRQLGWYVLAERAPEPDASAEPELRKPIKMINAIRAAMHDALADDEAVFMAGIDIGQGGNVFGVTRGLYEQFPERVIDTPISESAIIGLGIGAAMAGFRPIVELMYLDFIGVCFDQLMNQAAKLRYMTGGGTEIPLTVRTQFGAGKSSGAQHSQSLEALLAHIPGLTVVMPSTPADAYGLMRSAIDDPNPVVFIENRQLYSHLGPAAQPGYRAPIGRARIVRPGRDVTLVSISRMVLFALAAADELAKHGIDCEVIDLRTVSPLDMNTILSSVTNTNRLVIVHEAVTDFGIGAEIAAQMSEHGFWDLDAPVQRVGAFYSPAPYSPSLESVWMPSEKDVERAVRAVLHG
jgi:2-oxoisovalerate dehydrogenase E1 component